MSKVNTPVIDRVGQNLLRFGLRPTLKPISNFLLRSWGQINAKHYDFNNTIILASSPRGGSTWLAEIMAHSLGYNILWEPLNVDNNPEARQIGFYPDTYIPLGAHEPKKQEYIHRVLTGAALSEHLVSWQLFRFSHLLHFRGILVKFVRANLLLYWLLQQFPLRAVLLIRHPCATVASQLQWGWSDLNKPAKQEEWRRAIKNGVWRFPPSLSVKYPHLLEIYRTIETFEEIIAFDWALQTYIPLSCPQPHPWYLMIYERLVEESICEIDNLFGFLNLPVPPEVYARVEVPSVTTHPLSNVARGKNRLTGWKDKLSRRQVESILNIVHRVGIDFYSDDVSPDYKRLSAWM